MPAMSSYDEWNEAIGSWFFHDQNADRVVFSVDDSVLRLAMRHLLGRDQFESDLDAREDFLVAVRGQLEANDGHWTTGPIQPEEYPDHLGLLAAQVLACFCMDDDESECLTKTSYREWLARLL